MPFLGGLKMSKSIAEEVTELQKRIDNKDNVEDINKIQEYILSKLKSTLYAYTTLPEEQRLYILLELVINWIDNEMERRKYAV